MPVIDVFSGSCKGNLRVVLAMGRSEQIAALQRTRAEEYDSLSHLVRPVHLLDHERHLQTKVSVHVGIQHFLCVLSDILKIVKSLSPTFTAVCSLSGDCSTQGNYERAFVCDKSGEDQWADTSAVHSVG